MMRTALLLFLLAGCATEPAPSPQPLAPEAPQPIAADVPDDTEWTSEPIVLPGEASDVVVTEMRVAAHSDAAPGYDRVVFEFEGGQPGADVRKVDAATACGSGEPLAVPGASILYVSLIGARGFTEDGTETIRHSPGSPQLPALIGTVPACDFEGRLEWALGLASPEAYRVTRLHNPERLAVDIRHPLPD